ncbi:hypothetical protein, partial [Streptomyces sp. AD55]|uniref:hypothetical protein n=1 Tax=Streptomyces sp. AD55 TaxID=3242895 RepID=UPI0035290F3F
ITWAAITGDRHIPWLAVAVFAVAAVYVSGLVEKTLNRRRARQGRPRRTHARPRPSRKAN